MPSNFPYAKCFCAPVQRRGRGGNERECRILVRQYHLRHCFLKAVHQQAKVESKSDRTSHSSSTAMLCGSRLGAGKGISPLLTGDIVSSPPKNYDICTDCDLDKYNHRVSASEPHEIRDGQVDLDMIRIDSCHMSLPRANIDFATERHQNM